MQQYPVTPIQISNIDTRKPQLSILVPGSKSITNRALLIAALADGTSILRGVLFSDDSRYFIQCLIDLGFDVKVDEKEQTVEISGKNGTIPKNAPIFVGNAGTAARFLTAFLGLSFGTYHLDCAPQMKKRPMAPLLDSLQFLGVEVSYEEHEGFFPFTLTNHGLSSHEVSIDIKHSSQFLSALLISSCLTKEEMKIHIQGTHGMSYIAMTTKMMEEFGISPILSKNTYVIPAGSHYSAKDYIIEPDVSAACYFYGLAALHGITVMVKHVHKGSMQGDIHFLDILAQMGCQITEQEDGISITGPEERLHGISVDMSTCSDQTMTLAAIAPFADSKTTISGIGHIRFQECNRIEAIVSELSRAGIRCDSTTDSITIYPGTPNPCTIQTYEDHRMAMAFSLIGTKVPGIIIDNPMCCKKTFETYFDVLDQVTHTLSAF